MYKLGFLIFCFVAQTNAMVRMMNPLRKAGRPLHQQKLTRTFCESNSIKEKSKPLLHGLSGAIVGGKMGGATGAVLLCALCQKSTNPEDTRTRYREILFGGGEIIGAALGSAGLLKLSGSKNVYGRAAGFALLAALFFVSREEHEAQLRKNGPRRYNNP